MPHSETWWAFEIGETTVSAEQKRNYHIIILSLISMQITASTII